MSGQVAYHRPWAGPVGSRVFAVVERVSRRSFQNGCASTVSSLEGNRSTFRFETWVGDDLRTCGVIVDRPDHSAIELDGLDFDLLAVIAAGAPEAAARGKVVVLGDDGVAVFQTKPDARPELVWCGNGLAAVARASGGRRANFNAFGPEGKAVRVVQTLVGISVGQVWTLRDFSMAEVNFLGRPALRCGGLNTYAVVIGPLPSGVTADEARRAVAGPGLAAKLAVVTPSATGFPHVVFHNAHGAHGAAPATGMATLAVLARRSRLAGSVLCDGAVTYHTKAGIAEARLPEILIEPAGGISVMMPSVEVRISPLISGDRR